MSLKIINKELETGPTLKPIIETVETTSSEESQVKRLNLLLNNLLLNPRLAVFPKG